MARNGLLLATIALAAISVARAADPYGDDRPDENRTRKVYTNADLARFGPAPPRPTPSPGWDEEAAWQFVRETIEHGRLALETERRLEIERKRLELLEEGLDRPRARWVAPFAGVFGTSLLALPFRFPRLDERPPAPPAPSISSPHGRRFDPRAFMNERPVRPRPIASR